jgi:hypothetical protein
MTNEQPTNGSLTMPEKNKNNLKGPPPPVAPKPSWPRQTSATAAVVIPPATSLASYSQSNDENQLINDIQYSNVNVTERHPSQKFNRSSSMNQISTNLPQQQDLPPTRNKSLSIPDSRLIKSKSLIRNYFSFSSFRFPKGVHIEAFRLVSVLGRGHFGKVNPPKFFMSSIL